MNFKNMTNKQLREAFRIMWSYGTMPRKINDLNKTIESGYIKLIKNDYPPHWEEHKKAFLDLIKSLENKEQNES